MSENTGKAAAIAIIAGILLLISGTSGAATWQTIQDFVVSYITGNAYVQIAFAIVIFIASLGGLSVIYGGLLVGTNRITTGKVFIALGAGMGLIGMILSFVIAVESGSLVLSQYFTAGSIGIIMSIIARSLPKGDK